jgi:hypothetical protein
MRTFAPLLLLSSCAERLSGWVGAMDSGFPGATISPFPFAIATAGVQLGYSRVHGHAPRCAAYAEPATRCCLCRVGHISAGSTLSRARSNINAQQLRLRSRKRIVYELYF